MVAWWWLAGWLVLPGTGPAAQAQPLRFGPVQVLAIAGPDEGSTTVSSLAADAQGSRYVTGFFSGTQRFGSIALRAAGAYDMFVAKLDSSGQVLWAVQGGGPEADYGRGIGLDGQGNVYVLGSYNGATATYGGFVLNSLLGFANDPCFVVARLSNAGQWQWVRGGVQAGAIAFDGLAVSRQGHVWLAGATAFYRSTPLGPFTVASRGMRDILVAQLDAAGTWQQAITAGGDNDEFGLALALDAQEDVYVTGSFGSATATFGNYTVAHTGNTAGADADLFVARLGAGGTWRWAAAGGGPDGDIGHAIAVGPHGRVYVTGQFRQQGTFGTTSLTSLGDYDVLTTCLSGDGQWQWATGSGSSGSDNGLGIAAMVDAVFVGGGFGVAPQGTSLVGQFGPLTLRSAGAMDAFVMQLDSVGRVRGALAGGGRAADNCAGVVVVGNRLHLAGSFSAAHGQLPVAQFGATTLTGNAATGNPLFTGWLAGVPLPPATTLPANAALLIPNVLTPNNDGRNDSFAPTILSAGTWELTVYSRWGRQVYHSADYLGEWGTDAAAGIYFYQLRLAATGQSYQGWVEVLR